MTDPEIEFERLVSGDAGAIRSLAYELDDALHTLSGIREDLARAEAIPVWSGAAAWAFASRLAMLRQGLSVTRSVVVRARGALRIRGGRSCSGAPHVDQQGLHRDRRPGAPGLHSPELAARLRLMICAAGKEH